MYVVAAVWRVKSRQMFINFDQKWKISTSLQKLPKIVGDLGKIIVATGFKKLPKVK